MSIPFFDLINATEPFSDYVARNFSETSKPTLFALIQNYPYWKTLPDSAISNEQIDSFVKPGLSVESSLIPLSIRMMYELLKDIIPDRELHKLLTFNTMSNMTRREVLKSETLNQMVGGKLFDTPSQALIHMALSTPSQIVSLFNTPKTEIRTQILNPDFCALVTYLLTPEHHAPYLLQQVDTVSTLVTNYHIHIASALDMGILNKYTDLLPNDTSRIQLYICLMESIAHPKNEWSYDYNNQRSLLLFLEEALPSIFEDEYPNAFKGYQLLKSIGASTEQLMSIGHTSRNVCAAPLPELC